MVSVIDSILNEREYFHVAHLYANKLTSVA